MLSGIYCDEENKAINILVGGKIGAGTDIGFFWANGKRHEACSLCLRELEEAYDVGTNLNDKPVKELPLKIRLIFQDKDIDSINILIECLENIKNELEKSCTTK